MTTTGIDATPDTHPPDLNEAIAPPAAMPVAAPTADSPAGSAALRAARSFWLVWAGQGVSQIGDGLYGIAMAWWITQALGSATALAGYALCGFVPAVTMPFIAGSLVDRANRKALIALMDGAQGLAVTALAILLATGNMQLWEVYVGAIILSASAAIHGPALDATIPNLVPALALPRANGLYATSQSVSQIAGPLFGGALVGLVGLPLTMFINALTFWFATGATLLARIPSPRVQLEAGKSAFRQFRHDATYGYHWIWRHRAILYLLLIFTSCNFLIAPTYPLEALIIKTRLLTSGATLGLDGALILGVLSAAQAIGGLAAAVFFSRGYAIRPMAWGVCIGWAVNGIAALVFGWSTAVVLSVGMALFMGGTGVFMNIASQNIWMSYTPDAERGRIFAARRTIAWGIQPISIALGGLLAEQIGAASLFIGAGALIAVIALGNLIFNRPIRTLYAPDLEPAAAGRGLIYRR